MNDYSTISAVDADGNLVDVAELVAEAIRDDHERIVDRAVRWARRGGYCTQAEESLRFAVPDMEAQGDFWDSDGVNCRGNRRPRVPVYDSEGYDMVTGLHRDSGLDREGFNLRGYDGDGWNRDGFDRYGYDRNGRDRGGYDRSGRSPGGYDRAGYDREDYDRHGYSRYPDEFPRRIPATPTA